MLETDIAIQTTILHKAASAENPLAIDFARDLNHAAYLTWVDCMILSGNPWSTFGRASDYYDIEINGAAQNRAFESLGCAAAFIKQAALNTVVHRPDALMYEKLTRSSNQWIEFHQVRRDILAQQKKDLRSQEIPFTPFEISLYSSILSGANPWKAVQSFEKNIFDAITINPKTSLRLIQSLGIDMMLPLFPAIDSDTHMQLADMLSDPPAEGQPQVNGIEEFAKLLELAGISTQETHETAEHYIKRIIRILPDLEEYVEFDIPPNKNQQPEYYMQLLLGYSYFALHRKLQHNDPREAIASLIVRDGEILGAAINEPIAGTAYFKHAERITVERAREKTDDPTNVFEGADIYVSVEPCGECAGFLRTLNLHGVYAGPRTKQGGDTVHRYFTKRISDDDCPTGDVYGEMGLPYYPMPQIVQFGILQDKFRALIEEGQQWRNFIAKKFAMYA